MWFLRCLNESLFYFWEKQSYTIGRKNTDLLITNDESISRTHALLIIENNEVYLTDKGSRYGTYINSEKLNPDEKTKLNENAEIKFGLLDTQQSKFKLEKLKMIVVTSNVNSIDKKELNKHLQVLNASRTANWNKTNTHLVASQVILTAKVLCALTEEQPIVTVKYFGDYIESIKANLPPPDSKNYLPEINESLLSKNIKLEYNSLRRSLFKDKIFIFLTEKQKVQMDQLISVCGGETNSWQKNKFDLNTLKKHVSNYIFIEDKDDVETQSELYRSFSKCVEYLTSVSRRLIPLAEIALAIVHNSCDEYCNPLFNRAALLFSSETQKTQDHGSVLAEDTPQLVDTQSAHSSDLYSVPSVVEPSYDETSLELTLLKNTRNSSKRPLEDDDSSALGSVIKKTNVSFTFAHDTSSKKAKETDKTAAIPSTSVFLKKPSNPVLKKSNVFESLDGLSTSKAKTINKSAEKDNDNIDNPFLKKRKASKDIAPPAKKTPFDNVGNIQNISTPKINTIYNRETSNNEHYQNLTSSTIIKSTNWLSKFNVSSKQIKDECDEVKVKVEEDEEMKKIRDMFYNSIVINIEPIVFKREENCDVTYQSLNGTLQRNFKKFRKNKNIKLQTIIITNDEMCQYVSDSENNLEISDEEEVAEQSPELEIEEVRPKNAKIAPVFQRAKLKF